MGFTPKKQNASNFNNGNEYTKDSKLSYSDINNLIEGMLWVQENKSTSISLQSKSVTPTEAQQTITYDTGYNGLSTVTVNPIPTDYVKPSGSKTITLNGTYDITKFEEVIVSVSTTADLGQYTYPTTITTNGQHTIDGLFGYSSVLFNVDVPVEANLKSQQQIEIKTSELGANYITTYNASNYGYDGFKKVYIKNLYVKDLSLTDSNVDFGQEENVSFETTVDDGMYKTVIITKPQNLIPSNIVSGQTIFGVTGTHECETTVTVNVQPTKTAIPSKEEQTIKPDDGYNALAQVVVEKIPDEYIKIDENKGLSIVEKDVTSLDFSGGETCSVTVHINNPLAVEVRAYSSVLYLDKDGVATTITFTNVDINDEVLSVVVDALKNSMIVVYLNGISYGNITGNSVIVSGGITEGIGLMGLSFYNGVAPFYITGDGTIDISLNE